MVRRAGLSLVRSDHGQPRQEQPKQEMAMKATHYGPYKTPRPILDASAAGLLGGNQLKKIAGMFLGVCKAGMQLFRCCCVVSQARESWRSGLGRYVEPS
jgi:hypothetical protein